MLALTVACSSAEKPTGNHSTDAAPTDSASGHSIVPEAAVPAKVELTTQDPGAAALADTTQNPMGTIRLTVDGREVWTKQVPGTWKPFDRQYSKSFNVPANAVSAFQSTWNYSSHIFYLIREDGKWMVKSSPIEEGGEEGEFDYTTETEVDIPN